MQFDWDIKAIRRDVAGRKPATPKPKPVKQEIIDEDETEIQELLTSFKERMKPTIPKDKRQLKLALERFYDDEELTPEECYWLYIWFKRDFLYIDSWYEYLKLATIEIEERK